ncbi:MAG: RsmE family RNA methyltransferase [Minisyncoccia bacterium]
MAKIHRFIDNFNFSQADKEIEITGEIAHQMAKVLKLEINEQVELCDGKGISAIARIEEINKNTVKLKIEKVSRLNLDTRGVTLFCAVLKKENFELVVQKTTECGVNKIIPIITTRTVKTGLNMERLQKIAKEASEQSGRSFIPEIMEPISFEQSLEMVKDNECNIFFDAGGEDFSFQTPWERDGASTSKNSAEFYGCVLKEKSSPCIFIGPEGGWTPEESQKAKDAGFKIASLGQLTLRGETAAIVATYLSVNLK